MTHTRETQVLLVGAGPVGRTLDLVGRGIDVLVVEQNESGVVAGFCRHFAPVQPSLRSSPSPWHRSPIDSPGMVTKSAPSPGRGFASATPRAAGESFVVGAGTTTAPISSALNGSAPMGPGSEPCSR